MDGRFARYPRTMQSAGSTLGPEGVARESAEQPQAISVKIPSFSDLFRPLLEALGNGKIRTTSELSDIVAHRIGLQPEARAFKLKSGQALAYAWQAVVDQVLNFKDRSSYSTEMPARADSPPQRLRGPAFGTDGLAVAARGAECITP